MLAVHFRLFRGGLGTLNLDGPYLMTLRVNALRETQRAIEDPDRCMSLGLIVGVTASIFEAVSSQCKRLT